MRLCFGANGRVHPDDKTVAPESALDRTSHIETVATGIEPKRSGNPPIVTKGFSIFRQLIFPSLIGHGIEISLAYRGRLWENGYAERLIRTLKEEEVHFNEYNDINDARERIGHFIVQVYNRKRPHSALGYLTPVEFEQQLLS